MTPGELIEQPFGTYAELIHAHALARPDHPALIQDDRRVSFATLDAMMDRVAATLQRDGILPTEAVAICAGTSLEYAAVFLGALRAGVAVAPLAPSSTAQSLADMAANAEARLIFVDTTTAQELSAVHADIAARFITLDDGADGEAFSKWLAPAGSVPEKIAIRPEWPFNIIYSSGTTGTPKGATLTHHNILNNGFFIGEAMRLTPDDRLCIPVPLYHCFGMVLGNLACVTHGSTMVYPAEGFDPLATLQVVAAERCTALHGVPTMFIAMLDHPQFSGFDLSALRTGIMAGSPCPVEVMKRVVDRMNMHEVTIAYGMTETSPVSFQSSTDDPLDRRVSTVGRIQPHVEVKVVDADGRIVPRGTPGELLTRGYSVMLGYWNDPERTAEAIDGAGWMHTGDMATIDAEGYCNIVGRIKDMIIRGGENIYPREVEEYLFRHPKVQDVQVVGLPDKKYGEELCAWIVLREGQKATEADIRAFCDGQIAHYKIPKYIRFVESFPMTVTGKVQKYLIRQKMKDELALVEDKTA